MRHLGMGVGLFSVGTVISASLWYANAPDLSLGQPTYATASAKEAVVTDKAFIKQVRASLKEDVSEPLVEQRWSLQNASMSKGVPRTHLESRGLLVKAAYGGSYGVNKEFIKRACAEFAQRSP